MHFPFFFSSSKLSLCRYCVLFICLKISTFNKFFYNENLWKYTWIRITIVVYSTLLTIFNVFPLAQTRTENVAVKKNLLFWTSNNAKILVVWRLISKSMWMAQMCNNKFLHFSFLDYCFTMKNGNEFNSFISSFFENMFSKIPDRR